MNQVYMKTRLLAHNTLSSSFLIYTHIHIHIFSLPPSPLNPLFYLSPPSALLIPPAPRALPGLTSFTNYPRSREPRVLSFTTVVKNISVFLPLSNCHQNCSVSFQPWINSSAHFPGCFLQASQKLQKTLQSITCIWLHYKQMGSSPG